MLTEAELQEFLKEPRTLAIVGASTKDAKAGYYVPEFLMKRGFTIIPINPFADEIMGIPTVKSLDDLNEEVDGVIIYRRAEDTPDIARQAVEKGIPLIWLPLHVVSEESQKIAEEGGSNYIHDECPKALIEKWLRNGIWKN